MKDFSKPRQPFHSVKNVTLILGITSRTVYRHIESGSLRRHKIGRQVRIADEDLEQYIRASRK